jgi:hypothetical protein
MGGRCLDDELPENPGVEVADYYFEREGVVAELKCLSEDLDPNAFREMLADWTARGLIPPPPLGVPYRVYTRDLPEICQREFFHSCLNRLRNSTIKKANKQIRKTKERLHAPDARGLLLLANDGNFHLRPGLLRQLVTKACRDRFSSIDEAVIFTANFGTTGHEAPDGTRIWAPLVLPGRSLDRDGLSFRLADPFYKRYGEAAGVTVIGHERPAPGFSEIEGISYEGHPKPPGST